MQTRTKYTTQLDELKEELLKLTEQAVCDIQNAGAGMQGDQDSAQAVMHGRQEMWHRHTEIEQRCFDIILLQQPLVGDDFRLVSAAFRVVSDLAHIDSMAREVACLSQELPSDVLAILKEHAALLSQHTSVMVRRAMDAFLHADEHQGRQVYVQDDEVDKLYHQAEELTINEMRTTNEVERLSYLSELFMVAKYFERIGDTALRIAAWALFRVTGEHEVYSSRREQERSLPESRHA